MANNGINPGLVLASAMTVAVVGGFLLVVDTGMNARKAQEIHYDFTPRGAEAAVSTFFTDFETGKQVIKSKSDHFMATFFDAPSAAGPASVQDETASREAPPEEGSAPYSGRKKFWEDDYTGSGGDAGNSFQTAGGGEAPSGDSMSSGLSAAVGNEGPAKNSIGSFDSAAGPAGKRPAHVSRGIFGGAATGDERAVAPKLYAALSGGSAPQNAAPTPDQPWAGGGSSGYGGGSPRKGGTLSGMPGQNAGAALGGGSENMKSSAQSDYNSKMSGGAGAAASAAASGGAAPAVSSPKKVAAGGETGGSSAKTADTAKKTSADVKAAGDIKAVGDDKAETSLQAAPSAADNSPDLLKTVVYEKLNGLDSKYVSQQEAAGAPDAKLLKAGGMAAPPVTKSLSVPDPADLNSLSDERKTELKKELHVFMAELENKYGKMTDLYSTSCSLTPDVCKTAEISGSYLTMTTSKGATAVFGLKYVSGKWLLYTMDFKMPK